MAKTKKVKETIDPAILKLRSLKGMNSDKKKEHLNFIANVSSHLLQFDMEDNKTILLEEGQVIALSDAELQINAHLPFMTDGRTRELSPNEVISYSTRPQNQKIENPMIDNTVELMALNDSEIMSKADVIRSRSQLERLKQKLVDANKSYRVVTYISDLVDKAVEA